MRSAPEVRVDGGSPWKAGLVAVIMGLAIGACTSKPREATDAKGALTAYVQASFGVTGPSDREKMARYLAPELKERLGRWSDEQFLEAFGSGRRTFERLVYRDSKTISETEVAITYEIHYREQGGSGDARITHVKTAIVVRGDEGWVIREVRNQKQLIEFDGALTL